MFQGSIHRTEGPSIITNNFEYYYLNNIMIGSNDPKLNFMITHKKAFSNNIDIYNSCYDNQINNKNIKRLIDGYYNSDTVCKIKIIS